MYVMEQVVTNLGVRETKISIELFNLIVN